MKQERICTQTHTYKSMLTHGKTKTLIKKKTTKQKTPKNKHTYTRQKKNKKKNKQTKLKQKT